MSCSLEPMGPTPKVAVVVGLWLTAIPAGKARAAPPSPPETSVDVAVLDLDALLERFAAMPGLYAEFREEKHLALLEMPLVNEGTLHFAQGAFARHVESPTPSRLVVDRGRLSFADATGAEQIDLRSNPIAALFVESFTKILAGDRVALESMYDMQLHETGVDAAGDVGWQIDLRPRVEPLDRVIARVEVTGHGVSLESMRVVEVGGDETITTFSRVDPRRTYSAAERRRVFSARPPRTDGVR